MSEFFKKSAISQKDPVLNVQKVLKLKKTRNSKDSIKQGKEKLNESKTDKDKVNQSGTDIRNYFGKNVSEVIKLEEAGENEKCSNVFSFMMATRHKQDEAIRDLQARELNEAEELLPNIMKSIPKEQLLANFISKAGRKQPEASPLMDGQENVKPIEQNILNNITPVSCDKVIHSVLSIKKDNNRKSKTVSFSQAVETYEIVKEPDEHTREFIMDSELNKSKELVKETTFSALINYTADDLDVQDIFKDEIEQCRNSGKKKSKLKINTKPKIQTKNCPKDGLLVSEKENVKLNKTKLDISSFFKQSDVKNTQNKVILESELPKKSSKLEDKCQSVTTKTICDMSEVKISNADSIKNISQGSQVFDKDSNLVCINDSSSNCSESMTVKNCDELILDRKAEPNRKTSLLRKFRPSPLETKVPLGRSLRQPKKRQLDDFINIDSDDNSIDELVRSKELKSSRRFSIPRMNRDNGMKTTGDLEQDISEKNSKKSPSINKKSYKSSEKRMKVNQESDEDSPIEILEIVGSDNAIADKPKKLASIFMKKDSLPTKPPICSTIIRARRDFLFSETPVVTSSKQCTDEQVTLTWPPFPLQNHIQQVSDDPIWTLPDVQLPFQLHVAEESCTFSEAFKCPLQCIKNDNKVSSYNVTEPNPSLEPLSVHNILHHLKAKNPQFDVFKTFTFYLNCKIDFVELFSKEPFGIVNSGANDNSSALIVQERPLPSKRKRSGGRLGSNKRAKLNDNPSPSTDPWHKWIPYSWTQVFAPKDTSQVIANTGVKFQLKEWLAEWKHKSEEEDAKDRSRSRYTSSGDYSDSDQSDNELVNTILLSGPPGVGKTSLVYALGQELGIKVLEINASVRRQGKHIMTQLSEATQSHTVSSRNRCSLMSPVRKGQGGQKGGNSRTKKNKNVIADDSDSMDGYDNEKNIALILFEDIDIVFEEYDEGFMSAVSHFMAMTKRPIILTCNKPLSGIRAKIKGNFLEAEMMAPSPAVAANYLQLMCLANGVFVNAKELEHLVASNKGDVRKSILDLQFWALSGSSNVQWLRMEKSKLSKTPSEDDILERDPFPYQFFPKLSNRKSVDVPIASGSMWAKSTFPLISSMMRDREKMRSLHWSLISGNLLTLFPFAHKIAETLPPRYPLSSRDPLIMRAYEINHYSWLLADEESEEFAAAAAVADETKSEVKAAEISQAAATASNDVVESMARLFDRLCHLDVLETRRESDPVRMRAKYLTPLDDTCRESVVALDHDHLISDLASEVFVKESANVRRSLSRCSSMEDCLKATISSSSPDILFEPHQHRKERDTRLITELNDKVSSMVPHLYHLNRVAVATDYLSFVRTVARQDQLGNAMRKFKRSSRYLSHLKMMGYYLSSEECLRISNCLS